MAWFFLGMAALFEVGWAVGLKQAAETPTATIWIATVAGMVASVFFLGLAVRELPLGTAYAIWTGVGTAGVFVAGLFLFGDSPDLLRVICVGLILAGVLGLKLLGT